MKPTLLVLLLLLLLLLLGAWLGHDAALALREYGPVSNPILTVSSDESVALAAYTRYIQRANEHAMHAMTDLAQQNTKNAAQAYEHAANAFTNAAWLFDDPMPISPPPLTTDHHTFRAHIQAVAARKRAIWAYRLAVQTSFQASEAYHALHDPASQIRILDQARMACKAIHRICDSIGEPQCKDGIALWTITISSLMAQAYHATDAWLDEAITYSRLAGHYSASNDFSQAAGASLQASTAYLAAGKPDRAAETRLSAASFYVTLDDTLNTAKAYELAGDAFLAASLHTNAGQAYNVAGETFNSLQMTAEEILAYSKAAKAHHAAHDHENEASSYVQLAEAFHALGDSQNEIESYTLAAHAYTAANDPFSQEVAHKLAAIAGLLAKDNHLQAAMLYEKMAVLHRSARYHIPAAMYFDLADQTYKTGGDLAAAKRCHQDMLACEPAARFRLIKATRILTTRQNTLMQTIVIRVRRSHLMLDSYNSIMAIPANQIRNSKFKIDFAGENADDCGGPLREWFSLMSDELTSPHLGLLVSANSLEPTYQPNPCRADAQSLAYYTFIGRFLAMAIHSGSLINFRLTTALLKQLLGKRINFTDLRSYNPTLHHAYTELGASLDVSNLAIHFTANIAGIDVELCPGGSSMLLTNQNRATYLTLATKMHLRTSIRSQMDALLAGFTQSVHELGLAPLNSRALELLLNGDRVISVDDWMRHTQYEGYAASSELIGWFWHVVRSLSDQQRAQLLQFVTGSSAVPLAGFSSLQLPFTIVKVQQKDTHLPSTSTCFHRLYLPPYTSESVLQDKLLYVIEQASTGFGLA